MAHDLESQTKDLQAQMALLNSFIGEYGYKRRPSTSSTIQQKLPLSQDKKSFSHPSPKATSPMGGKKKEIDPEKIIPLDESFEDF